MIKTIAKQRSDKPECEKFVFKNETEQLGYVYVNTKTERNAIYVFVEPKFRGNGLGSRIFAEMKKQFNHSNFDFLLFDVEKANVDAVNMIIKNNGKLLYEDNLVHLSLKLH